MSEQKLHRNSNPAPAAIVLVSACIGLALMCGMFVYFGLPLIVRWLNG